MSISTRLSQFSFLNAAFEPSGWFWTRLEIEKNAKFTMKKSLQIKKQSSPHYFDMRCCMVAGLIYNYTPRGRALTHKLGQSKCKQLPFFCFYGIYSCKNLTPEERGISAQKNEKIELSESLFCGQYEWWLTVCTKCCA